MNKLENHDIRIDDKIDAFINNNSDKPYLQGFRYFLGGMMESSVYKYLTYIKSFMDFTNKNPEDLRLDDYTVYLGSIKKRTSSSYQIATYSAMKKFSKYLKANQINDMDPMIFVDRPKKIETIESQEKRNKGFLNKSEIKSIIKNVEDGVGTERQKQFQEKTKERDLAIIMVFLSTGMRASALCNLNVDNVDNENHSIVVRDKGAKIHEYILADEAWVALENWIRIRYTNSNALFVGRTGKRLGYDGVHDLVKKYANMNNKNITPHKLRATYATQLYNATKDIHFVQKCMDHASPSTTALYIRGQDNETKEASEIMNNLLTS